MFAGTPNEPMYSLNQVRQINEPVHVNSNGACMFYSSYDIRCRPNAGYGNSITVLRHVQEKINLESPLGVQQF